MTLRLSDVTALLDGWYDPASARVWDAVGLVCGDPDQPVARCSSLSTPRLRWSTEAAHGAPTWWSCHHPLLLTPVHGVAATTPKGRVVHRLVRSGTALSPRTPTPTCRPTGSTSRWPGRSASSTRRSWWPTAPPTSLEGPSRARRATRGHGRIGRLAGPTTLRDFEPGSSAVLPATAHGSGSRATPAGPVETVVVGSGVRGLHAGPVLAGRTRTST